MRGSALNEQDGGAVRFLYSLGRGGIPPKPPFRHALAGTILFSAEFEAVPISLARHFELTKN
ncbi:MAG: hypothetical protein A2445_01425 [Candidatus Jacksonbacteria bacterium RIFOXYC2_FULL_44_29]|nr:MAG: hypothetical protein A2445_01425 [Candidatus Jacksonbacteria bacterium RIFOXYC2_FULL_44_29]OGY79831.1 MAG: hypothetical protein A2550_02625 [Candidatus Jacksonbacteria bacterium RIFOXYD2_FULL_43_21]